MRKYCIAALALALMLTVFTGCRRNVSNRPDGTITDPTVTTGTVATMPSTDTAPIATAPSAMTEPTSMTESNTEGTGMTEGATEGTAPTDASAPEGRARHALPQDPMHRS